MKLMKVNKKVRALQMNFLKKIINSNGKRIETVLEEIRENAQAAIDRGEVKGKILSPWFAKAEYCGWANYLLQTALINDDVGIVVNSFSGFNSCIVDIKKLLNKGYTTLTMAFRGSKKDAAAARTVALFLETFQGKYNYTKGDITRACIGYESVTDTGKEENGYKIVDIDPQKAAEIIRRIEEVDIRNTPFEDLLAFCLDMAAFARQGGENTIDTRKKPVLIIVVGLPGLENLKTFVQYMSKQTYEFKICWDENGLVQDGKRVSKERGIRLLMNDKDIVKQEKIEGTKYYHVAKDKDGNPEQCYLQDKRLGGDFGESYQIPAKDADGNEIGKKLVMCDAPQRVWRVLARRLKNFLEDIAVQFNGSDIQKMLDLEMRKIELAKSRYGTVNGNFKTLILEVLEKIKEESQSAFTASEQKQAQIKKLGKDCKLAQKLIDDEIDNEKAELSEIMRRLQNKARVVFDTLEAVMSEQTGKSVTISPADRVRLVWAVVLGKASKNGIVNWKKVSSLPQTLLEPEYLLWVLDAFKGIEFETLIPRQTKDRVRLEGTFKDMTSEELEELNGLKVPFENGEFVFEGETKLSCSVPLTGTFDIKVEDGKVFALHDIESLVVVPKANHKEVIVKLTSSGSNEDIMRITKATVDASQVLLIKGEKGKGNPICVVNDTGSIDKVGTYLLHSSKVATQMLNIDFNDDRRNGLKGTVNFYKPFDYRDKNGNWHSTAFLAIDISGEISKEERTLAGFAG